MEREIKFRGRDKNGVWHYGSLDYNDIHNEAYIVEYVWIDHDGVDFGEYANEVLGETVGQYTGLKDKNGKEIYEGDILQETTSRGIVMFGEYIWDYVSERGKRNEKRYGYYLKMIPQEGWRISVGFTKPLEMAANWKVIGNIYENPNLIKRQ